MMRHRGALVLIAGLVLAPFAAHAQMIIKSAIPLWMPTDADVWPRPLDFDKESIGYGSIFAIGTWKSVPTDCQADDDCTQWYNLEIASVFHGGFVLSTAPRREGLDLVPGDPTVIIDLGKALTPTGDASLFAIQTGLQGSKLAIITTQDGAPVKHLNIHMTSCEGRGWLSWMFFGYRERRARRSSYWKTNYCEVRSRSGLRRLARDAAATLPVAKMTFSLSGD